MRLTLMLSLLICSLNCSGENLAVHFANRPCIKPVHEYQYKTCDTAIIEIEDQIFIVPAGFESDLASIPRWYWPILSPRYSSFVYPAIMHDYLYSCPGALTRKYADDALFAALVSEGVSKYTAYKFYYAVRLFGSSHFKKNNYCDSKDF